MLSNKLSAFYGFTMFGESHGPAIGLVIEDIKPNIDFPYSNLEKLLTQRSPSRKEHSTSRRETDSYEIISGVFEGKTTGMPICILFRNKDARSHDYDSLRDVFRPGHADYAWYKKFKIYDHRGGGRASGRETIARVAASSLVEEIIKPVEIKFQTRQIGGFVAKAMQQFHTINDDNPFCWAEPDRLEDLNAYINKVKAERDTAGGLICVRIDKLPAGLGDPVMGKLNALLASALFSIATVWGVSFGDGFAVTGKTGSETNDQMNENGFLSNHAGGINGGISNGQPVLINIAVRPVSSHGKAQKTINRQGKPVTLQISGRHDVCHIPRLIPVIEAMIKLTLADFVSRQKLISGEELNLQDYRESLEKLDEDMLILLSRRLSIVNQVRKYKRKKEIPFRDEIREQEMEIRWKQLAAELDLPEKKISGLLKMVLSITRHADTVGSLQR